MTSSQRLESAFGFWRPEPHKKLREFENGTIFLLRPHAGSAIHLCELFGNEHNDIRWKALRLSDMRVFSLEQHQTATFLVLCVPSPAHQTE